MSRQRMQFLVILLLAAVLLLVCQDRLAESFQGLRHLGTSSIDDRSPEAQLCHEQGSDPDFFSPAEREVKSK